MSKSLPSRPNLEQLKNQAKDLLKAHQNADADAVKRVQAFHPNYPKASEAQIRAAKFSLNDAQLVVAREYGLASWPKLKEHVESLLLETAEPMELFKTAFKEDDAVFFRKLVKRYPEAKTKINEPIATFDSPTIIHVRSSEMLDALLEASTDINGRSR